MKTDNFMKQKGFSVTWQSRSEKERLSTDEFSTLRDWQVKAFDQLKNASCMILNAPMGSGKSWMMCLLSAYKMQQDQQIRTVIAVPQTIIASGFAEAKLRMPNGEKIFWKPVHNLCHEQSKGTVDYIVKWLAAPPGVFFDRTLICTHATLVAAYKNLKENNGLHLLRNLLLWIDEAHHVKNMIKDELQDEVISNGLGDLTRFLLSADGKNIQLGLTTASFFRGDRQSLLTEDMLTRFERFNLPYDEYLESMHYLKSFSFDFLISGQDYTPAIEVLAKCRKAKDIIYVPHPNAIASTGDKYKEVETIITKYHGLHGGERIDTNDGLTVLKREDGELRILNLVCESRRNEKKNFLSGPLIKNERDALDVIIALGMFKEGANWIWADRSIIVGPRSSLVDVIQMVGRLFRDAPGKGHVEVIQLLPFALDQQNPEEVRENLNNYLKAIYASLILEDVLNPVKIKMAVERKISENGNSKNRPSNVLQEVVPDETKRVSLIDDIIKGLLDIIDKREEAGTDRQLLWDEYQKIVPQILEKHGINERRDEVAKQVWGMFARRTLQIQGISVEDIDFDILQKTHPLEFLLRYTSGSCSIDTFQKLREAIQAGRKNWRLFEEARSFVVPLKLRNDFEWRQYVAGKMPHLPVLPDDVPKAPWAVYEDWINLGHFLGTNTIAPYLIKYRSYEGAREFARSLGLKRKDDWRAYLDREVSAHIPLPDDIPAAPDKTYRRAEYGAKWSGWGDFLGTGRISLQEKKKNMWPYNKACAWVQKLGLKTAKDWCRYVAGEFKDLPSLPLNIPKKPDQAYSEWKNWRAFLGSQISKFDSTREFWLFEPARAFVHRLGLKNQKDWQDYCAGKRLDLPPKPSTIPSNPLKKYKDLGWKNLKDWLGDSKN